MRIAYFAGSKIPSASANSVDVMNMCGAFSSLGHEVTLFARQGNLECEDEFEYYGVDEPFNLQRFNRSDHLLGTLPYYLKTLRSIPSLWSPDLLYGRHAKSLFFFPKTNVPLMLQANYFPSSKIERWLMGQILNRTNFSRLLVLTGPLKEKFLSYYSGLSEEQITVAPCAATVPDQDSITDLPDLEGRKEVFKVGYVGHLHPDRGIQTLLELAKECTWADFHIIGGTPEDIAFWKQRGSCIPNLFFYGFIEPNKTESYRRVMDVLVAPYRLQTWKRNSERSIVQAPEDQHATRSPLKLFEYMGSRKPIVVSDFPVFREVIEPGDNALVCAPEDLESWKKTLIRVRDDSELREHLSASALNTLKQNYTYRAKARKILQLR